MNKIIELYEILSALNYNENGETLENSYHIIKHYDVTEGDTHYRIYESSGICADVYKTPENHPAVDEDDEIINGYVYKFYSDFDGFNECTPEELIDIIKGEEPSATPEPRTNLLGLINQLAPQARMGAAKSTLLYLTGEEVKKIKNQIPEAIYIDLDQETQSKPAENPTNEGKQAQHPYFLNLGTYDDAKQLTQEQLINKIREQISNNGKYLIDIDKMKLSGGHFPNGFNSWFETHFNVVEILTGLRCDNKESELPTFLQTLLEQEGNLGLYTLSQNITVAFEALNHGREWDGEFWEEIHTFTEQVIKD